MRDNPVVAPAPFSFTNYKKTPVCRLRGFTLVELLMILLILGILIGIAVPRYLTAVETSKKRVFCTNVRNVVSAIEVWRVEEGEMYYPSVATVNFIIGAKFGTPPRNPYTGTILQATTASPSLLGDFYYGTSADYSSYTVSTMPDCTE